MLAWLALQVQSALYGAKNTVALPKADMDHIFDHVQLMSVSHDSGDVKIRLHSVKRFASRLKQDAQKEAQNKAREEAEEQARLEEKKNKEVFLEGIIKGLI